MSTAVKRLYEGLFLVNSNEAASDWQGVISAVEKVLKRSDAEIVSLKKWDDRKMAYSINGADRGTYILVYFNVDPLSLKAVERDVQLSERIMRVMILKTDKMSQEDMSRETPLDVAEKLETETEEDTQPSTRRAAAADKDSDSSADDGADDDDSADDDDNADDAVN